MNDEFCVSVYIADVVSNIEAYNLWDVFSERVSSIYLPDKRLCLIPESFSENSCGLQENKLKRSMKVDFYFNSDGTEKKEKKDVVSMVDVYINKNFVYEEESLINHPEYMSLLKLTQLIESSTKNSHDLVSFWMIKTNQLCAKHLKENKKGVFRKTQHNTLVHRNKAYSDISSEYVLYQHNDKNDYAHVTSPIRRLVDILNQLIMYENISFKMLK
jgi:exoribonuclease R